AAAALRAALGDGVPGASVTLTKNLPVASGLGGGSADAAAALRLLLRLWRRNLPGERLAEIGLGLGADVPICLAGGPRFVGGIGGGPAAGAPFPPALLGVRQPGRGPAPPAGLPPPRSAVLRPGAAG